jgi:hypothetical protein
MTKKLTMPPRQRGALGLTRVVLFSALVAAAAMAAIFSMRHERNLFAEGWSKASAAPAQANGGALRKCVIDGRTVISNTDCKDSNRTSKAIEIHDTKGFEAPKLPAPAKLDPTSNPVLDKMIEKQLH